MSGWNLILNSMRTPDGTVIQSRHRHDFVTHTDENGKVYMVDGGLDYIRRSVHEDQVDLSLYDDQPHEVQRVVLSWGTYGINGDQPLSYIRIADMETGHLEAVLKLNVNAIHRACMEHELLLRGVE